MPLWESFSKALISYKLSINTIERSDSQSVFLSPYFNQIFISEGSHSYGDLKSPYFLIGKKIVRYFSVRSRIQVCRTCVVLVSQIRLSPILILIFNMLSCVVSCDTTKNPQNTTLPNTRVGGSHRERCAGWVALRDILIAGWLSLFCYIRCSRRWIARLI